MAFEKHIAEHARRTKKALEMGGEDRLAKQAAQGRLNARQRVDYLFDPGTFLEIGMFARGEPREEWDRTPADGKICGYGRIEGREAAVVSHDITVKSASSVRPVASAPTITDQRSPSGNAYSPGRTLRARPRTRA